MNAQTAKPALIVKSLVRRLVAVLAVALGLVGVSTPLAFADYPAPDLNAAPAAAQGAAPLASSPVVTSGVSVWLVVLLVAVAVAVGFAVAEVVHTVRRHHGSRPLATA